MRALHDAASHQHPRTMAGCGQRLALFAEFLDELTAFGIQGFREAQPVPARWKPTCSLHNKRTFR